MTEQLARDAMVPEPLSLDASASAQEAAEALSRPEVRAVFVCSDGRLTGVITRKTLVREVVARGLDPKTTAAGTFAEPPNATIDSSTLLGDAFDRVWDVAHERGITLRDAALVAAIREVSAALEARGIYP